MITFKKIAMSTLAAVAAISSLGLQADVLLDSTKFNVTLNLVPSSSLSMSDLTFGTINPARLRDGSNPVESTTGSMRCFSNSMLGQTVKVVASEPKYLSKDGKHFLMLGQADGNPDTIAFYLKSYQNADGTEADKSGRDIFPGDYVVDVVGGDNLQDQSRDLWARVTDNEQIRLAAADAYLAVLTLEHYSKQ